jgi:2-polyprenyl-6-hydroxyphenyl methylase/3-demethylubiquinone-9 3-methyltransferase
MDLASKEHWTKRYALLRDNVKPGWTPNDYNSLVLEKALLRSIRKQNPYRILEIGCGASKWLPYLAKRTKAIVAGIDYSGLGCELARAHLKAEGVSGTIYCLDLFEADPMQVGEYDFVFSLGLVEHFTDLEYTLGSITKFLSSGGTLFTEVPNLRSFHGLLSRIWQPKVMAKHQTTSKTQLIRAYQKVGLSDIEAQHCGLFSFDVVAWGVEPRWPGLERKVMPFIRRTIRLTSSFLRRLEAFDVTIPFFSPFICVTGKSLPN